LMRRLVLSTAVCASFGAMASCGSRTGLFGAQPDQFLDASDFDVDQPDARRDGDATTDRDADARIDAPIDGPIACIPGTFDFQLAAAQIMFVLDRSGSMAFGLGTDHAPTPPLPSRWQALHDALAGAIVPFDSQIEMGAKFFPEADVNPFDPDDGCRLASGVGISPGLNHANTILNTFNSTDPKGGTPTALALTYSGQFLNNTRGIARTMVIATDGAPNCNGKLNGNTCTCTQTPQSSCQADPTGCLDDVATVSAINDIFLNKKIPVYVIGIGGQSFASTLDAMAVAGGRPKPGSPKYLPGDSSAEMQAAFTTVRDSVAKCTYLTPSAPTDPDAITVDVAGKTITRDPTHTDGWDWSDQEFGVIELFGNACNTATPKNVNGTIQCKDD
jgi:hypothetical protein